MELNLSDRMEVPNGLAPKFRFDCQTSNSSTGRCSGKGVTTLSAQGVEPGAPFVPPDFEPPAGLAQPRFVLEPLGPRHNERDYAAWTSSSDHIHATPGFTDYPWPHPMTLDENRGDLERHQRDFAERTGFTYTVLDPADGDVIGCLYIYAREKGPGAHVTSWVRADHAELDAPLAEAVAAWLVVAWPFEHVRYLGRPALSR